MSATIERPTSDTVVAAPPQGGSLSPETLETLESIVVAETHRAARVGDIAERAAAMAAELNSAVEREL